MSLTNDERKTLERAGEQVDTALAGAWPALRVLIHGEDGLRRLTEDRARRLHRKHEAYMARHRERVDEWFDGHRVFPS